MTGPQGATQSQRRTGALVGALVGALAVALVLAVVATPRTFGALTTSVANSTNTAASAIFAPATCQDATDIGSPSFIYPFAEASGTVANDTSANNRPGTYRNTAGLTYGVAGPCPRDTGRAVRVNPNNNRTTFISGPGTTVTGPQTFSIQAWFQTASTRGGRLIGFGNGTGTTVSTVRDRHLYLTNAGKVVLGIAPGGTNRTIASATGLNDNTWHHVVGTMSSSTGLRLYVDGVQVAVDAGGTSARVANGQWRVAWDDLAGWPEAPTSDYFQGSLAWASVHDTALTAAQVSAIYAAGSP